MSVELPSTVVVIDEHVEPIARGLRAALPELDVRIGGAEPDVPYALVGFSPDDLSGYGKASWIHISGAGANGMLAALDRAGANPALITRTLGRMGHQIGEYVLSYALADAQKHSTRQDLQAARDWDVAAGTPSLVADMTALILGTGGIGSGVASVLGAVGATCIGASRSGRAREGFSTVIAMDALPDLPKVDLVVGALPLTPDTMGRIDSRVFERLDGALLINVGRGATADIGAVKAALAAGCLRHAVLDVVLEEPLPPGSDLWDWPGVTITPHVSGLTLPQDTVDAFVAAYRALERGETPELVVDTRAGY